jgi:hypothetical protein
MQKKENLTKDVRSFAKEIGSTITGVAKSSPVGLLGALAQPYILNIMGNTTWNSTYWLTNAAQRTIFANREWMKSPEIMEGIDAQIATIPKYSEGFYPTLTAETINIPFGEDLIPECHNMLGDMLQVNTQDGARELVTAFQTQCSSPEAFTGNRFELFMRHLPDFAKDTITELTNRVTDTAAHPLARWLDGLGLVTRTDENGLAQVGFNPESLLQIGGFLGLFLTADYGLKKLAENEQNPVANLYNRPLSELNGAEKAGRFILNGVLAAGTIGSLLGIVDALS